MITNIQLKNIGPSQQFDIGLSERLNIFTGDNGLGKTFILDVIWFILTGTWADKELLPKRTNNIQSEIKFCQTINKKDSPKSYSSRYNFSKAKWVFGEGWKPTNNIVIYAQVDGSFTIWDPARTPKEFFSSTFFPLKLNPNFNSAALHFSSQDIWNGLTLKDKNNDEVLCNGLLRDWLTWQYEPGKRKNSKFSQLCEILELLSPPGTDQNIEPGKPMRIKINDVRDIPTIKMPYETIPITHASAGIKRILELAYLLVWSWSEHKQASDIRNQKYTNNIVFIIDEVEAHLHPQWQRTLLPAVMLVANKLDKNIQVSVYATTHAPLVLASIEPIFAEHIDQLLIFTIKDNLVNLESVDWIKQGDSVGWLTSDVFGLKQARSREAEVAIEAAEAFMRGDSMERYPEKLRTQDGIHKELLFLLPGHDQFWPRWIIRIEKK